MASHHNQNRHANNISTVLHGLLLFLASPSTLFMTSLSSSSLAVHSSTTGTPRASPQQQHPPCPSTRDEFIDDIIKFLEQNTIPYRHLNHNLRLDDGRTLAKSPNPILALGKDGTVAVHICPMPTCREEWMEPRRNKIMTDLCGSGKLMVGSEQRLRKIIHLHQDVFAAPHLRPILQSRLLTNIQPPSRRIYARKTTVRRIDSITSREFLCSNHLWGSTASAKYSYGLFLHEKEEDEELVAVATFSSRRIILRNNIPHRSHELLRFCSVLDTTVVGAISKLLKAFIREQKPDDIITVIDRDWGCGEGWESLGFESVQVMPPLIMAVGMEDGVRRHLVGAGIAPAEKNDGRVHGNIGSSSPWRRLGLPSRILDELATMDPSNDDPETAKRILSNNGYHAVYDSGVERLMYLVPDSVAASNNAAASASSSGSLVAKDAWVHSFPRYGDSYYSKNGGISLLLKDAEEEE